MATGGFLSLGSHGEPGRGAIESQGGEPGEPGREARRAREGSHESQEGEPGEEPGQFVKGMCPLYTLLNIVK